jgi:hypothetical protein
VDWSPPFREPDASQLGCGSAVPAD